MKVKDALAMKRWSGDRRRHGRTTRGLLHGRPPRLQIHFMRDFAVESARARATFRVKPKNHRQIHEMRQPPFKNKKHAALRAFENTGEL
ncbi:hypothetical protein [Ereboglobus luteus]|uniref:hypothetical protein n=1 Tax=Ereboglobus luteus TaxID=1796921 RepID=UPI00126021DE|nr:hypothetical protein [Ereboglobus luteus]